MTWGMSSGEFATAANFNASDSVVSTPLNGQTGSLTYEIWTYRAGGGTLGLGRIFDAGSATSTLMDYFFNDDTDGVYYYSYNFSGSLAGWTIPQPSLNARHFKAMFRFLGEFCAEGIVWVLGLQLLHFVFTVA